MGTLAIVGLVVMVFAFARYNAVRKKWAGIIGVGGSYLSLMGVLGIVSLISGLINKIAGRPTGANNAGEVVMLVIVAVLGIGYLAFVMLTRCQTPKQRILLPFVACVIAAGFIWRLIAAVAFHMPMETGAQESGNVIFPEFIYDTDENPWQMMNSGGDNATYYCQKTGQQATFYASDFSDGSPTGFHRR